MMRILVPKGLMSMFPSTQEQIMQIIEKNQSTGRGCCALDQRYFDCYTGIVSKEKHSDIFFSENIQRELRNKQRRTT